MADIQLAIEGPDAAAAAQSLLKIKGISGTATPLEAQTKDLATAGIIVGIVVGTIATAEQFRKWYREHKESKKISKVVMVGKNGTRLELENASAEDVQKFLDKFLKPIDDSVENAQTPLELKPLPTFEGRLPEEWKDEN